MKHIIDGYHWYAQSIPFGYWIVNTALFIGLIVFIGLLVIPPLSQPKPLPPPRFKVNK